MNSLTKNLLLTCVIAATYGLVGCARNPAPEVVTATQDDHSHGEHGHSHEKEGHSHDGWWCDEHGVPEEVCGQCNSKLAAQFQKKGDWCKEHDRPDSQCFICHPELEAKFAARYAAKFGTQPPKPE